MTTATRIDARTLRGDTGEAVLTAPPSPAAPTARRLRIVDIRLDGGTQPRAALNQEHIDDLAADLRAGAILPPVDVMYDGGVYWLFDGYHRLHAHKIAHGDSASIDVRVHQGTLADAQWASFAVNKAHGLRRTTEDKQRAIIAALKHPNGASRSNREIARHLGVDHVTVGNWREKLELSGEIHQIKGRTITRGDQTYTQNTTNIGAAPRRDTYASGLPKLNMPLRMAAADTPPTQALGTEFTVSELIDLVHACATRTGMAPALDGTPFWFELNADVAAAGKGKRKWSVINLRAAVNAFHPRTEHQTPDTNVVPSDAARTRQQGAPLGKCRACNRPLYDPAQAAQGIGACCAAKQAAGLIVDGDRPLPDWATDDEEEEMETAEELPTEWTQDRPLPGWTDDDGEADERQPHFIPAHLRNWMLIYNGDGTAFMQHQDGRMTDSESTAEIETLFAEAERMDEALLEYGNPAADCQVMKPTPGADDRRARLTQWQLLFEQCLAELPKWAELTGRHVLTGDADRGLRKLLDATRSELAALNGQAHDAQWGEETEE